MSEQKPTFLEYLRARFGRNWIVGRNCLGNRRRYGDYAVFLTARQFNEAKAEYAEGADA